MFAVCSFGSLKVLQNSSSKDLVCEIANIGYCNGGYIFSSFVLINQDVFEDSNNLNFFQKTKENLVLALGSDISNMHARYWFSNFISSTMSLGHTKLVTEGLLCR
ncbi:hypothetical protein R3W88_005184 [Solanum pinnatisectum]|uniref:Uncharacterized protein n=1 Tax=Solanum pinnatisectum TaxID=50273 RepID=A0AAV9KBF7_9SOLN|nr:hypothetical protein R3W88_005184 [Solanum pinnatisectum]